MHEYYDIGVNYGLAFQILIKFAEFLFRSSAKLDNQYPI